MCWFMPTTPVLRSRGRRIRNSATEWVGGQLELHETLSQTQQSHHTEVGAHKGPSLSMFSCYSTPLLTPWETYQHDGDYFPHLCFDWGQIPLFKHHFPKEGLGDVCQTMVNCEEPLGSVTKAMAVLLILQLGNPLGTILGLQGKLLMESEKEYYEWFLLRIYEQDKFRTL